MAKERWTAVDQYLAERLLEEDSALHQTLKAASAAELPAINVSPMQGKMLHLLARIHKASRILEIGTLAGYSTIWLARALPPKGILITLEVNPRHAEVARANISRAGLSSAVDLRLGPALESLAQLQERGGEPFDLIFIDADKENNPLYMDWAIRLSRVGSVIVCDNVIRDGDIIDEESPDRRVQSTRQLFDMISREPRLEATAIQTVGSKGYDGFVLAVVKTL